MWKHSHWFVSIQLVLYIRVSHFIHIGGILGMLPCLLLQKKQAVAFPCTNSITACTSDCPQNHRSTRHMHAHLTALVSLKICPQEIQSDFPQGGFQSACSGVLCTYFEEISSPPPNPEVWSYFAGQFAYILGGMKLVQGFINNRIVLKWVWVKKSKNLPCTFLVILFILISN